ncbi:hypothetical protein CVT25_009434 [Psilocybe cyanescens]|uniref:Uncharacterized protein n=1 Tax=Psilocybe cyanescens TaxID=93625 RepID=A0A409XVH2_PSICY|nr:hypothetical protein CVT25_009434 [Psilocybe cyanescens]
MHESLSNAEQNTIPHDLDKLLNEMLTPVKVFSCLTADFTGTLHCEALLASLFSETSTDDSLKFKEAKNSMVGYEHMIGVLKLCCAACATLLDLLSRQTDTYATYYQRMVTACTLPIWLPGHIMDSMNDHFGSMLQEEIVKWMCTMELRRNRSDSSSLCKLSTTRILDLPISAERCNAVGMKMTPHRGTVMVVVLKPEVHEDIPRRAREGGTHVFKEQDINIYDVSEEQYKMSRVTYNVMTLSLTMVQKDMSITE